MAVVYLSIIENSIVCDMKFQIPIISCFLVNVLLIGRTEPDESEANGNDQTENRTFSFGGGSTTCRSKLTGEL